MTWEEFEAEIARRGGVRFWWRDDDAATVSPHLRRALALSESTGVPLALAVVPEAAEPGLFTLLHDRVSVLQHGTDHRNRAAAAEKKTEYPAAEPIEAALARVADGFGRLSAHAKAHFFPVFAPPWNRMRADLLPVLPAVGIRGVSMYGLRVSRELAQVNAHVDIVAWRRGRRFIGESEALALALKNLSEEPVGWLTHHAVHDEEAWRFLERLFGLKGVRWLSVKEAFSYTGCGHG